MVEIDAKFQSLFSWNLLLMKNQEEPHRLHIQKFQSLFSWNLLLMDALTMLYLIEYAFQSLFSWNLLLMSGFFSFFFPFDTVKPPILSPPLA